MARRARKPRSIRNRRKEVRTGRSVRVKPHSRGPRGPDTGKSPVPVTSYRRRKPRGR
jgi:hypothetical protein